MRKPGIWILLIVVAVVLGVLVMPTPAMAQDEGPLPTPSDDEINAIAHEMYCPVCENTPLDVCGTEACAQWRQQIKDKLELGWTEEQIKDYFVELYGDRVLAEPPLHGINWMIYIVPPVVFVAGVFVLYRGFRNWQKPLEELEKEAEQAATVEDEYISRLEEELKNRH